MSARRREETCGRCPRPEKSPPRQRTPGGAPRGGGGAEGGRSGGWGPPDPLPAARALILTCHRPLGLGKGPPAAEPRVRDKVEEAGRGGQGAARPAASAPACAALAHAQCRNWRPTCRSRKRGVSGSCSNGWSWAPRLSGAWERSWAARSPVPGNGEKNYSDVRGHKQTCWPRGSWKSD